MLTMPPVNNNNTLQVDNISKKEKRKPRITMLQPTFKEKNDISNDKENKDSNSFILELADFDINVLKRMIVNNNNDNNNNSSSNETNVEEDEINAKVNKLN